MPHISVVVQAMRSKRTALMKALCLGLLVPFCLSGCQSLYPFEVRGKVRSTDDGSPLADVRVVLRARSIDLDNDLGTEEMPVSTLLDGTFRLTLLAYERAFNKGSDDAWTLVLSKPGYADEVIDITPSKEPSALGGGSTLIVVIASLRPK
jgi:hypothetical protein